MPRSVEIDRVSTLGLCVVLYIYIYRQLGYYYLFSLALALHTLVILYNNSIFKITYLSPALPLLPYITSSILTSN